MSGTLQLIIPDAWRAGLAVLALRMASRRSTIAVLALVILLVAMAAASGSSAQAAADALLIDTGTNVAFESISGEAIGALDVGTSPEGNAWFRAAAALDLQFARGFVNPESAKNLLSEMLSEAVCLHRRAGMSGTGTDVLSASDGYRRGARHQQRVGGGKDCGGGLWDDFGDTSRRSQRGHDI